MGYRLLRYLILIIVEIYISASLIHNIREALNFGILSPLWLRMFAILILPFVNIVWIFIVSKSKIFAKIICGVLSSGIVFLMFYLVYEVLEIDVLPFYIIITILTQVFFWELMNKLKFVLIQKKVVSP